MSSIAAALRTKILSLAIAEIESKVFKDFAPPTAAYPYVTYADRLNDRVALTGDKKILARNYMVQVDLWEKRTEENDSIISSLIIGLDTASLTGSDNKVFRCRLIDTQRIVQFDDGIIHHALTLNIYRKV